MVETVFHDLTKKNLLEIIFFIFLNRFDALILKIFFIYFQAKFKKKTTTTGL